MVMILLLGLAGSLGAADKKPPRTDRHGDPLPPGAIARLGTMRFQHDDSIYALAYSPDGKWLASAGTSGVIRLWDSATGKESLVLEGHQEHVLALAFVPAGEGDPARVLVSASGDKTIRFWDLKTGKERLRINHPDVADTLAVSPDGKLLASGGSRGPQIFLWNAADGKEARRWMAHPEGVREIVFTPNGKRLVSGGLVPFDQAGGREPGDGSGAILWEARTGKRLSTLAGHPCAFRIALSDDGKLLAASCVDRRNHISVILCDLPAMKPRRVIDRDLTIAYQIALTRNGALLAAAAQGGVKLFATSSGAERGKIPLAPHEKLHGNGFTFSPDGRTLALALENGRIRLWDVEARRWKQMEPGHHGPLTSVAIAPDGKTIVTASRDEWPWLWDRGTGKPLRQLRDPKGSLFPGINCIAWSADGRTLALGQEGAVRLWDIAAARYRQSLQAKQLGRVVFLAYSRDGRWLATACEEHGKAPYLHLWDAGARTVQRSFTHRLYQDCGNESVAFSPDGALLATTSSGGLRVYRRDSGAGGFRKPHPGSRSVAFAPSGMLVASAGYDPARVHDAWTGEEVAVFPARLANTCRSGLAFSPDGRLLAAVTGERVSVWDLFTRRSLRDFTGHRGAVNAVAFTPDGKALVSASEDGTALIWDLQGLPVPRDGKVRVQWKDLHDSDRLQTHIAWSRLRASPEAAVALLRKHVKPTPVVPAERLESLIRQLDDDAFAVREQASRALKQLGLAAEKTLRRTMTSKPSPEVTRRITQLLRTLDTDWQRDRYVRLLLGDLPCPAARALLRELAGGNADSRLTQEAKAILERTDRRGPEPKR